MIGDILQPTHLIFILLVALLVLGPKRLPEVGKSLGRGLRDFRQAISGEGDDNPITDFLGNSTVQDVPSAPAPAPAATAQAAPAPESSQAASPVPAAPVEPVDAEVVPTATESAPAPEPAGVAASPAAPEPTDSAS